jgi:prepilin signal peptidase PulO-like enzyme (type II secretory pathway)
MGHVFTEILTGGLFVASFILHGWSLMFVGTLIFLSILIIIILYDLAHTIIPNLLVYPLIILGLILAWLREGFSPEFSATIGASIIISLFFVALWAGSQGRAMGLGDAKLSLALALFVGFPLSISGLLLSFWLGAVIAVLVLLYQVKQRTINREVPFAPYLALGFLCAYFLHINLLIFLV